MEQSNPDVHRIVQEFVPRKIIYGKTTLKYTTVAISMPDGDLKDITSFSLNGNSMENIYNEIIKPSLHTKV